MVKTQILNAAGQALTPTYSVSLVILSIVLMVLAIAIKKARALRSSDECFRSLIQNSSDIITVLKADGTIRYVSPSISRILGYQPEDLSGKNKLDYIYPEDAVAVKAVFANVIQNPGIAVTTEYKFRHVNGSWVCLESVSHNLLADENVRGLVINSRDVTHRYQDQAELLEQEMHQREKLTLQNFALEKARRMAEAASRSKDQFLANMSHEIRTPMNGVLGVTGLLLETPLTLEQQEYIEIIRVSGNALLNLINEILDLSKLEAGKMALETLDFDLSTCIEEVLELLAPQAHTKNLEIAAMVYRDVPTHIQGDAGRLRQILMNLIGNAIKFTSAGEVILRVELQSETSATTTIRFSVMDTGPGIAPEEQHKLFTAFSQVDGSTTRQYSGTGLGLAISKQIVSLMGGDIGVQSQLGRGSEFWFEVTFAKSEEVPSGNDEESKLLINRRLLLVDDNATSRKIIRHQATALGIQVDEAMSAAAALIALQEAQQKTPYDVVLIDMQMSQTDGLTLGKQIKANSAIAEVPLIMLAFTNQRDEVQQALQIGFAACLVKPIKTSRLIDTLIAVLEIDRELERSADREVERQLCPTTLSSTTPVTQFKLKILLAEDNLMNQRVILKQLNSLGYSADIATNGQEVLQLLEKVCYNLIFMDCQMPILNGLETTRTIHLRQDSHIRCRPVVVAMTANATKEDRQSCLDAGMDDYLSKPVLTENLAAVLERWNQEYLTPNQTMPSTPTISLRDLGAFELPIDWQHLHRMSEGNAELELELLQMFVKDSYSHLKLAKAAIAASDFQQIEQEFHHLKGTSRLIGATSIHLAAQEIEQLARNQQLESAASLTEELEQFIKRVQAFLRRVENNKELTTI